MAPSDVFFTQVLFFLIFVKKMQKIKLPEEVLADIIKTVPPARPRA